MYSNDKCQNKFKFYFVLTYLQEYNINLANIEFTLPSSYTVVSSTIIMLLACMECVYKTPSVGQQNDTN